MGKEKHYILLAGVNGAGKSSLYHSQSLIKPSIINMVRINSDEILISMGGDWKNTNNQLEAMRKAISILRDCLDKGISFNQETTLTGHTIIQNMLKAKSLGYNVEMHYIGLESVDLAISRVNKRVKDGGHGIPSEVVKRRYDNSLSNLKKVIPICNRLVIYDNTNAINRIALFRDGKLIERNDNNVSWLKNSLFKDEINKITTDRISYEISMAELKKSIENKIKLSQQHKPNRHKNNNDKER